MKKSLKKFFYMGKGCTFATSNNKTTIKMENLKPIKDTQLAYKLDNLWGKLHTVHVHQHHDIVTQRDKDLVLQMMNEILELRDQVRNKIYLTELEKENN